MKRVDHLFEKEKKNNSRKRPWSLKIKMVRKTLTRGQGRALVSGGCRWGRKTRSYYPTKRRGDFKDGMV